MSFQILQGDVLDQLRGLPEESVHCVVTSPPYWGLRDYGVEGQIGLEKTPAEYIAKMVEVFREVRRVLRSDGTCWVNMGDCYAGSGRGGNTSDTSGLEGTTESQEQSRKARGSIKPTVLHSASIEAGVIGRAWTPAPAGLKQKDLVGMPWRLAFALQADGWWLRQDIIWAKPNPMPESVTDRCTKAHEYIFLLTKSARYYYDAEAIKEECAGDAEASRNRWDTKDYLIPGQKPQKRLGRAAGNHSHKLVTEYEGSESEEHRTAAGLMKIADTAYATRNKRSVWEIATEAFPEAHFATFPTKLVEPCILAGSPQGGTVLDPFNGAGTTGLVALRYQRSYIGIELNPEYAAMSERRIQADNPMFNLKQEAV